VAGRSCDVVAGHSGLQRVGVVRRLQPHQTSRHGPGTGDSETAALRDLDDRLRGVPAPNGTEMEARERRFRLAYLEGAEEWSRETTGRGMTESELEGVVRRFR
jgi:hypothetical protein